MSVQLECVTTSPVVVAVVVLIIIRKYGSGTYSGLGITRYNENYKVPRGLLVQSRATYSCLQAKETTEASNGISEGRCTRKGKIM